MKFMYLGEGSTTIFGHTFKAGEAVEVTDAHAIKKLTQMTALFAHDEEQETPAKVEEAPKILRSEKIVEHVTATEEAPKRRGRPPNATQ